MSLFGRRHQREVNDLKVRIAWLETLLAGKECQAAWYAKMLKRYAPVGTFGNWGEGT